MSAHGSPYQCRDSSVVPAPWQCTVVWRCHGGVTVGSTMSIHGTLGVQQLKIVQPPRPTMPVQQKVMCNAALFLAGNEQLALQRPPQRKSFCQPDILVISDSPTKNRNFARTCSADRAITSSSMSVEEYILGCNERSICMNQLDV